MAIGPNLPSVEQVLEIAEDFGLELSADEANTYRKLLRGAINAYRRLDEMAEFRPPVEYPRTPGYRPEEKDNPFNGWYWRCEIDGAPEGSLAGKTVGVAARWGSSTRSSGWLIGTEGMFAASKASSHSAVVRVASSSPSIWVATGPSRIVVRSTIRVPARGPLDAWLRSAI